MKPKKALEKAINKLGSQSALARACGVTQQAVQQWCESGNVPPARVQSVVAACEGAVSASDLRPDIFIERSVA